MIVHQKNSSKSKTNVVRKQSHTKHKMRYVFTVLLIVFVAISIVESMYATIRVHSLQTQMDEMTKNLSDAKEQNQAIINTLQNMHEEQKENIKKQEEKLEKIHVTRMNAITNLKEGFTVDTDLCSNRGITVEDMNNIIDQYDIKCGGTEFKGHGDIFIKASQVTGLNPIYIFAHACVESGFGNSYLAKNRFNYFGINAVDVDPNQAYAMGSNMEEGIINGAAWIKKNYYAQGYTTLRQMKEAGYATSDTWVISILGVANNSIVLL